MNPGWQTCCYTRLINSAQCTKKYLFFFPKLEANVEKRTDIHKEINNRDSKTVQKTMLPISLSLKKKEHPCLRGSSRFFVWSHSGRKELSDFSGLPPTFSATLSRS